MPRKKQSSGDVPHCTFHTREAETGQEIRLGPCNGFCRITEQLSGRLPLTEFLKKLLGYSDDDLQKANAEKAAKVYDIAPEHAAGYIRMEKERRGLRAGA